MDGSTDLIGELLLSFVVPGEPEPTARARTVVHGGVVRSYTPKPTVEYQRRVRLACQLVMSSQRVTWAPYDGPVFLSVQFFLTRPASRSRGKARIRRPQVKPDLKNLIAGVEDAITNARLWLDDSRVVGYVPPTGKWYADTCDPCTIVRIYSC